MTEVFGSKNQKDRSCLEVKCEAKSVRRAGLEEETRLWVGGWQRPGDDQQSGGRERQTLKDRQRTSEQASARTELGLPCVNLFIEFPFIYKYTYLAS